MYMRARFQMYWLKSDKVIQIKPTILQPIYCIENGINTRYRITECGQWRRRSCASAFFFRNTRLVMAWVRRLQWISDVTRLGCRRGWIIIVKATCVTLYWGKKLFIYRLFCITSKKAMYCVVWIYVRLTRNCALYTHVCKYILHAHRNRNRYRALIRIVSICRVHTVSISQQ